MTFEPDNPRKTIWTLFRPPLNMKAPLAERIEKLGGQHLHERPPLTIKEQQIYDSVMQSFPATNPESAYNIAIQGGIRFQFIYK